VTTRPVTKSTGRWRLAIALLASSLALEQASAQEVRLDIPRTWDPEGLATFELPLATPEMSPQHVSAEFYDALPVRPVQRTYPIYHLEREPEGYWQELHEIEPEVVFDRDRLHTEADWIAAGALVFEAPIAFDRPVVSAEMVRDPEWWDFVDPPLTAEGTIAGVAYVVRERGRVEAGNFSCAMCHTRVMPDGSVIAGAQGNFPVQRLVSRNARTLPDEVVRRFVLMLFSAPWLPDREAALRSSSRAELEAVRAAIPPGVVGRQGSDLRFPPKVPDLIGIRERRYLDATGLVRHRGPGDLMRYAAVNQGMDVLARHGDFVPGVPGHRELPRPGTPLPFPGTDARYSDEQLYALALYLYSLEPPSNPNPTGELARQGEQVFRQQGCDRCHTPPLYTNNSLVAAPGFEPPPEHRKLYDVLDERVDTDPTLTMSTRRGTGYYKVPSLLGLWYRSPLEHNGSIATLEDWFDPARFDAGYRPTGWGPHAEPRAVEGHPFGVGLPAEERGALIAFLRTL
jgi:hypothetical protein